MSLSSVFNIAGSGMSAQSTRLNTISSNIANAETVSSSVDQTYRARHPVFATMLQQANGQPDQSLFAEQNQAGAGVQVLASLKIRVSCRRAMSPTTRRRTRKGTCITRTSTSSKRWLT